MIETLRDFDTADCNADCSCTASLTLRLVDRMHYAFADTLKGPVCSAHAFEHAGDGVLNVFIFASAAL